MCTARTILGLNWIWQIQKIQGGPTVQRFSSIFSQLLQLFPRLKFEQAVKKHRSDYSAKGFSSWGQFVAMLFCQFGRAHSLPKDHLVAHQELVEIRSEIGDDIGAVANLQGIAI